MSYRSKVVRPTGPVPVHPVLFAAWFVLGVFSANLGEATVADVLPTLLVVVAGSLLAWALAVVVLGVTGRRDLRAAALVTTPAIIVILGYGHVDELVRPYRAGWLLQGSGLLAVGGALIVARRIGGRLVTATRVLNVIGCLLVAAALASIVPFELARVGAGEEPTSPSPIGHEPAPGPSRDVWYLVFDRYGAPRDLETIMGVQTDLPAWLAARGFVVAPDSHANYVSTLLSLTSSLNMQYLDDLAARAGRHSADDAPLRRAVQDHALARFLRSRGYQSVHVGSPYQATNVNLFADHNPRRDSLPDFAAAFLDTTAIPAIARRLGVGAPTVRERNYETALFQWRTLHELVDDPGPKLVFSHFLLPHPPYVFAADGTFIGADGHRNDARAFAEQLAYTDGEIKRLVERLLALPEARRPIIVLQADEGPYPDRYNRNTTTFDWSTATAEEIELKFGILNAYFLPGLEGDSGLYSSITPVNSFRLILSRYFDATLPLLPDRSFTSTSSLRPYDFVEVTDRLTP